MNVAQMIHEAEKAYAINGLVPETAPVILAFHDRVIGSNYRRAEARHLENNTPSIDQIRTHISRNQLASAETKVSSELQTHPPIEHEIELKLELARIKNAQAKWSEAVTLSTQAIHAGAKAQTLQTLFQVRSIAQFELGQFKEAQESLSHVLSLAEIYPMGLPVFYAKTLEIKINARLYGVDGVIIAFQRLWQEVKEDHGQNFDTLLTLLRVQSDLKRIRGFDFSAEALAAYFIAQEMGDELYQMLALAELMHSPHTEIAKSAKQLLPPARASEHARIADLLDPSSLSETAQNLRGFIFQGKVKTPPRDHLLSQAEVLYISCLGARVHLKKRTFEILELQPKVLKMIETISLYRMDESEVFTRIWNLKYSLTKHHENLRTTFKRIKQQTGMSVKNSKGTVELPHLLVVGELHA